MDKINKYYLMLLPSKEMITVEAKCLITTQGAYMFYDEFDIASKSNLIIASYPVATTIIKKVDR
jgi:hypothetical protein